MSLTICKPLVIAILCLPYFKTLQIKIRYIQSYQGDSQRIAKWYFIPRSVKYPQKEKFAIAPMLEIANFKISLFFLTLYLKWAPTSAS